MWGSRACDAMGDHMRQPLTRDRSARRRGTSGYLGRAICKQPGSKSVQSIHARLGIRSVSPER